MAGLLPQGQRPHLEVSQWLGEAATSVTQHSNHSPPSWEAPQLQALEEGRVLETSRGTTASQPPRVVPAFLGPSPVGGRGRGPGTERPAP